MLHKCGDSSAYSGSVYADVTTCTAGIPWQDGLNVSNFDVRGTGRTMEHVWFAQQFQTVL